MYKRQAAQCFVCAVVFHGREGAQQTALGVTLELGGNAVPLGTEVFGRLLCFHTAVFQRRTVFFVLLRKLSALCLKLLFEDRAGFFVELLLLLGDLLVCKERQATEAVRDSICLLYTSRCV